MRTQHDEIAIFILKSFAKTILSAAFIILMCYETASACTYDEAVNADWGGYDRNDVVRILTEDITEESSLAPNQKISCLIAPMSNFSEQFDKVSDGIKYEAICAISAMETGHFKSDICQYHNNVGGMRNSQGYMHFDTKEDGIEALAKLLTKEYLDPNGQYYEGNTIIDIGQHYNQSTHWVVMYTKVRLDMEKRINGIEPEYPEDTRTSAEQSEPAVSSCEPTWRCNENINISTNREFPKFDNSIIRHNKACNGKVIKNVVTLCLGSKQLSAAVLPCRTRKKRKNTQEKSKKD